MKPTKRIGLIGSALGGEARPGAGASTRALRPRAIMAALLAIALAGMALWLWSAAASAEEPAEPLWSADMTVEETSRIVGARRADLFSNVGGSGNLTNKRLWYFKPIRRLLLSFEEGVPNAADYTLQAGDLSLEFPADSSGKSSFAWKRVDVDWEEGQVIHVRIVPTSAGDGQPANTPATGAPTIEGTAQAGQTLTAGTADIADPDGLTNVSYGYQWLADDADIDGATSSTYELDDDDVGKTIKVRVSFTDDRNNAETLISEATAAVTARPNTPATGAPTIEGTAQAGQTLTANTVDISDSDGLTNVSYGYQWLADDADIEGKTDSTYVVSDDEVGKTIKVRVSFTDDRNNNESLTSEPTGVVTLP